MDSNEENRGDIQQCEDSINPYPDVMNSGLIPKEASLLMTKQRTKV